MTAPADEIDRLLGRAAEAVRPLRDARPGAVTHAQGSYEALFAPHDPRGVSVQHRHAIALRIAALTDAPALAQRHRSALPGDLADAVTAPGGTVDDPVLAALLAHTDADPDQLAVLEGFRAGSPYFRLLARDARVLGERTATDKAIFYRHVGLPRAERELSATVTSRLNGCVYCASVHSALSSQLSGRTADVQRLLDEGVEVRVDARWDAITDFAAALSTTPPRADATHVARLREVGLSDAEISDIVHAAAFFSWANRLMLTLGEPEVPAAG